MCRCDICADNFHGHPELPGGVCKPCDCSNNWDSSAEGNCDPHTGECLKCLFYTEGFKCERCVVTFINSSTTNLSQHFCIAGAWRDTLETQSVASAVSAPVMCSELIQKSMHLMDYME